MDEKIIKIVIARLRRWQGQPINKERLASLREEIFRKTGTNKFAPFANIRKWVKEARKEMARRDRAKTSGKSAKKPAKHVKKKKSGPKIPAVDRKIESGLLELKQEIMAPARPPQEVNIPKPPVVFDKVYLQSMTYELASMRSSMERISKQLDKLERALNEHKED